MRAKITYLGGPETGDVGRTTWGDHVFELNKAVEITDQHIIQKAQSNKFFRVELLDDKGPAQKAAPHDDDDDDEPAKKAHPTRR